MSVLGKPVVRAAVYTRKSSDEGLDQEFNSLDVQYEACSAYIASQRHEGWKMVRKRFPWDRPEMLRVASRWLKMTSRCPRWPKIDPKQSKHGPTQSNMAQHGNLIGPKEPQEWPKMASQCSELSQEGLKMATR